VRFNHVKVEQNKKVPNKKSMQDLSYWKDLGTSNTTEIATQHKPHVESIKHKNRSDAYH
jgi:hypothetical protein